MHCKRLSFSKTSLEKKTYLCYNDMTDIIRLMLSFPDGKENFTSLLREKAKMNRKGIRDGF